MRKSFSLRAFILIGTINHGYILNPFYIHICHMDECVILIAKVSGKMCQFYIINTSNCFQNTNLV